jgi:hypothetical protein
MSLARMGVIALLGLALAPTALAKPVVTVTVGVPQVVIAPAPVVVVHQSRCPGPNSVWVDGSWRRDAYGRQIWVGGHCAARPVVVHHHHAPPPPTRTVIVRHH